MATASDLREIEAMQPWLRPAFQAGLASLTESTAEQARRFAADMDVIAGLAAQVPRCPNDDRGATPWTSFRREIAVARRLSDMAAAAEIRCALALTRVLPVMRGLLQAGSVTVSRARAFVTELEGVDVDVARAVDAELAHRAALLPQWRIRDEVRRAVARLEPEAAALRAAASNAGRSVELQSLDDDQAAVVITGPAVPLTRWHAPLDGRARALKAAGDPRTLDQLRFDLAVTGYPCASHSPADPTATADDDAAHEAGLRPSFVEAADPDCRHSRPVQAAIGVPVETSLGLSNEPGWLDGYGWLSAPTCRLLLVDAELRRLCVDARTGQPLQLDSRRHRPPPTPDGVRRTLLDLVVYDATLTSADPALRAEPQHDPSEGLRELVELRDRFCDGPTGTRRAASAAELDHDLPYPEGPTAAWNLVARATRTHQLKHYGWTPLRTPTSTFWFTPAGQVVEVPRQTSPPPGIDPDPTRAPELPEAELLAELDAAQLAGPQPDDYRPDIRTLPPETTAWTWVHDDGPLPF